MKVSIPVTRHRIWQLAADAALIGLAWWGAFFLCFDQDVPRYYQHFLSWQVYAVVIGIGLGTFVLFGFYNRWWRYVSTRDMWGAFRGVTVACLVTDLVLYAFPPEHTSHLPKRIVALDYLLLLAFVAGTRLLARSLDRAARPAGSWRAAQEVLIVGAGDAGQLVVREMQRNRRLAYTPIGFVDDDPRKKHIRIHGVRVLGTTDEVGRIVREHRPDEVLIAMPSAPGEMRRKVLDATRGEGVAVKTLPGLHELIAGDIDLAGQIRPVAIEDVLGREQVEVDLEAISAYIKDRVVLVTGGGGSIGSELCRQVVQLGAKRLVLVDKAESALYEMQRELVDERHFTAVIPVLADCGDAPEDARRLRAAPPAGRLPRRRVQARADARDEPDAGRDEQRPRDARDRRGLGRVRRRAVRVHLDRQGGEAEEPARSVEGGVRVDRRVVRAAATTSRPGSWRCGSGTCSARPAR